MTLRVRIYAGQELDSLILQGDAEGHVISIIVENEDGDVVTSFSQTDNQVSSFTLPDFLGGEDDED